MSDAIGAGDGGAGEIFCKFLAVFEVSNRCLETECMISCKKG